jgi:hypothetical protein
MGVFATRSPFRPNPIGLSSVKLLEIKDTADCGTVLLVSGADLLDGTPIYDIKPYLAYTDSHPEATSGFAEEVMGHGLKVVFPEQFLSIIKEEKRRGVIIILENDPRPSYIDDPERIYGMRFGDFELKFTVADYVLTVIQVVPAP